MTGLVDTHVHLDYFDSPSETALQAYENGVKYLIIPGVLSESWPAILTAAETIPGVWAAPGIHPQAAGPWTPQLDRQLREAVRHPRVVAIGEVGLDSQVAASTDDQEKVLRQMIRLACEAHLPLLLHVRRATGRTLTILREERAQRVGGIFHAFSGSLETARQLIDLGFALGIGGIVTYPEARHLPEVVKQVPGNCLVLESDAPDMAPHPHRRERNHPAFLPLIARQVARLRNWSFEETAETTTHNALRILSLP